MSPPLFESIKEHTVNSFCVRFFSLAAVHGLGRVIIIRELLQAVL